MKAHKILFLSIVAFFVLVPIVNGASIGYTETIEVIDQTGWSNNVWNLDEDVGSAPPYSIAEIIACNDNDASNYAGVRNTASGTSRYIVLHEAEPTGNVTVRFYVNVDGSGNADFHSNQVDYILVGWWTGVGFTEEWDEITVGSTQDNMWFEYDLDTVGAGSASSPIVLSHASDKVNAGRYFGSRNTSSTLDRRIDLHEAEPSGHNMFTQIVMSDADNKIDIFIEEYDEGSIFCQGYFNGSIGFREAWYFFNLDNVGEPDWDWIDLSSAIDEDGRVVDIFMEHEDRASVSGLGVREEGTSIGRYIVEHESESTGFSGFSMSVTTNDANGQFEAYDGTGSSETVWFQGYFNWTVAVAQVAPVNDALFISNMDDTDDLMAERKNYYFFYNGHDDNGYADINRVYIRVKQGNTTRMEAWFDEDTNGWLLSSGNWELVLGSCNYTKAGNNLNLTFALFPSWDATEEPNIELEAKIWDDEPASDTDVFQTDYADIIITIRTSSMECVDGNDPDRVDIGVNETTDFSIRYIIEPYSTFTGAYYPPDSEFDYVAIYDSLNNEMVRDYTIINGDGSGDFFEATVQSETYNLYVNLDDPDWTDKEIAGETETIIWDQIKMYNLGNDDPRRDISTIGTWFSTLAELDYDGHVLGVNDNFTLNGQDFTWNGTMFISTYNSAIVQRISCDVFDYGWEDTYGITVGTINALNSSIIWDRIQIISLVANDPRIDINTDGVWVAQAQLEYPDGHDLGAGDNFTLDGYDFTWNGTHFVDSDNKAIVQQVLIDSFDSGWEDTYEITVGTMDGNSQAIIWDRMNVTIFTVNNTTPNLNEVVGFNVAIRHEFDNVQVTGTYDINRNGSLWINNRAIGLNFTDVNSTQVVYVYDILGLVDSVYGITVFTDASDLTVTWTVAITYWVYDLEALFGAGLTRDNVTGFVEIYWNDTQTQDGNVTYEVQVSLDGVAFNFLARVSDREYNHSGLSYLNYRWYRVRASLWEVGVGWNNSAWSPINLERVFFYLTTGGVCPTVCDRYIVIRSHSMNILIGTQDNGFLNGTWFSSDGLNLTVGEVVGSPAFEVYFNFTGFNNSMTVEELIVRELYDGNLGHNVTIQVLNQSNNVWMIVDQIVDGVAFTLHNISLSSWNTSDLIQNDILQIRFVHHSAGNINHDLILDYIVLNICLDIEDAGDILDALDINWFLMILYLGFLAIGFAGDDENKYIKTFAGVIGILFGLFFYAENAMITIALVFFNIWVMWDAIS